ncbi:MAG: hypothetical protein LBB41_06925 [Prevotellaceae bacterium]|nr:hypothetical protein [Prevotellaceae bacterium]
MYVCYRHTRACVANAHERVLPTHTPVCDRRNNAVASDTTVLLLGINSNRQQASTIACCLFALIYLAQCQINLLVSPS